MKRLGRMTFRSNEQGATAVEFAVVVALLLIILFAILEFGFIFLQEHFVANAAREGLRIGIRANNFESFTSLTDNNTDGCDESPLNRGWMVDCQIRDYLETLYDRDVAQTTVSRVPSNPDGTAASLVVSVEVPNFYPQILSALVELIPGAGFVAPTTISFTATGEYEDLAEP